MSHLKMYYGIKIIFHSFFSIYSFLFPSFTTSNSCMIPDSAHYSYCYACSPEFYSKLEASTFEISFPEEYCLKKIEKDFLALDIFVQESPCSSRNDCNGSILSPFDNLITALEFSHLKTMEFIRSSVNIYLIGEMHYITQNDLDKSLVRHFFRKINTSVNIMPISYLMTTRALNMSLESPILVLKTNQLNIFISGSLEIHDLTIMGNDLPLISNLNRYDDCSNLKKICCSEINLNFLYVSYPESSLSCGVRMFENYKPKNGTAWGVFNIENFFDSEDNNPVLLKLVNCKMANVLLLNHVNSKNVDSALSFIAINRGQRWKLNFTNVSFENCFFTNGVLALQNFYLSSSNIKYALKFQEDKSEIFIIKVVFMRYNLYQVDSFQPSEDGVFVLRDYSGKLFVEGLLFNEYRGSFNSLKLFDLTFNTNQAFIHSIVIKNCSSHIFLYCHDCAFIHLKNLYFYKLYSIKTDKDSQYIKISSEIIYVKLIRFYSVDFDNSNPDHYCLNFETKKYFTAFSNVIVEEAFEWSVAFKNGIVFQSDAFIFNSFFSKNILYYQLASVFADTIVIKDIILNFNRAIEIDTGVLLSGMEVESICFFNRLFASSYFVATTLEYSNFMLWSKSGETDILFMNNTLFENVTTFNPINDHSFFSSHYVYKLVFYNTLVLNFQDGCPPSIMLMYDFGSLDFFNLTYQNIYRNRFYLICIEGGNFSIKFLNALDNGLHFDCFFIDVDHLTLENVYFQNIYSATRMIWYVFTLENVQNLFIRNFTFISSNFTVFDPSDYDSPYGTNIINFETCEQIYFQTGHFEVAKSNTVMNELFLFSCNRNLFFSLKDLHVVNFNCLKGYSGDPIYENGIISFVSSYSYLFGAVVDSTVMLNGIFIEDSFYCKNGLIGFLNIDTVLIENITTKNTIVHSGGALSFIFCKDVHIKNMITTYSKAINSGGVLFSRGSSNLILKHSFISFANSYYGGALYVRDTKILFFIEDVIIYKTSSQMEGGGLYLLETNCIIAKSSMTNTVSENEGGGIFQKGKNLTVSDNFICYGCFSLLGGFLFVEKAENLNINNVSIIKSGASYKGGCILIYDALVSEVVSLLVFSNSMYEGSGVIYIENQYGLIYRFIDLILYSALALECSFLSFNSFASLLIENVIVSKNQGSIMSLISQSFVDNQNITIARFTCVGEKKEDNNHNNYLPEALFHFQGIRNLNFWEIRLMNLIFQDSGFYILSTNFRIDVCWIVNQFSYMGVEDSMLFLVENSALSLNSIYFEGQNDQILGFLMASQSNLALNIVKIIKCQTQADSCIKIESTNISIQNSYFFSCKARLVGVITAMQSTIAIENTTFKSNSFTNRYAFELYTEQSAAIIHLDSCVKANISFCNFTECFFGVQVALISSVISFSWSLFTALENISSVKAIWAIDCDIKIDISEFIGFNSEKGGALRLENKGPQVLTILINGSDFRKCISDQGGVFFIKGHYDLVITICRFSFNSALKSLGKAVGNAGVGLFDSQSLLNRGKIRVIKSTFIGNWADSLFATIFSTTDIIVGAAEQLENSNLFINNSDGLNFTKSFSCFPLKFVFYLENIAFNPAEHLEIASGKPFNIKVEMFDNYLQRFTSDDQSQSFMELSKISNNTSTSKAFLKWTKAKNGIFTFDLVEIYANPDSYFELNISFIIDQEFVGLASTISLSIFLKVFSKSCVIGELYIPDSKICFRCPEGQFSLEDPKVNSSKDDTCYLCPENAFCPGGDIILPRPGYWRFSNSSTNVKACIAEKACLGYYKDDRVWNSTSNAQGPCLKNNYGPLCFLCEKNAARIYENDVCMACEINFFSYLKPVMLLIIFGIYILFQVNLTMRNSKRGAYASALLKQLINHFQIFGMISLVGIDVDSGINSLLKTQEYFLFITQYNYPIECFATEVEFNKFSLKVIVSTITPLIFFLATLIIWLLLQLVRRATTSKEKFLDQMMLTLFLIISLLFPQIVRSCSSLLNCISLDESSQNTVLFYSPDVKCWEEEHRLFILAAIPGFICWGVFFPLYLSIELYRKRLWIKKIIKKTRPKLYMNIEFLRAYNYLDIKRGKLNKMIDISFNADKKIRRANFIFQSPSPEAGILANIKTLIQAGNILERDSLNNSERQNSIILGSKPMKKEPDIEQLGLRKQKLLDFESIYSSRRNSIIDLYLRKGLILKYLYKGYSSKYFYWEMVIFMKKFLLILIGNLKSVLPQGMLKLYLIILLGAFFISQIRKRPFITDYLNNIQYFSSLTIFLTVFLGILGSNIVLIGLKTFTFVLVILINIIFLFYWGQVLWKNSSLNLTIFNNCLRKLSRITRSKKTSYITNTTETTQRDHPFDLTDT